MNALILYALFTPALWYLFGRAMITEWLWSWYEDTFPRFGDFMKCAACAGTWWGFVVGVFGHEVLGLHFLGIDEHWSFLLVGICSMWWTPVLAAVHDRALRWLSGTHAADIEHVRIVKILRGDDEQ